MSRKALGTFGLAMVAVMATACSDLTTAPPAVSRGGMDGLAAREVSDLAPAPSSVGWQAQARALVAANNMSPLAATRVFAALSLAQYRAVLAFGPCWPLLILMATTSSPRMGSAVAVEARSRPVVARSPAPRFGC
jgi:hypothetical protein